METTARHRLPLIAPGQAQKELTHNEALALIDAGLHPAVEGGPGDDPPAAPQAGRCWIVGAAPTGAWAGQAGAIAAWTAGGWRFVAPREGLAAWDGAAGAMLRHTGGAWLRPAAVSAPAGGGTIDAEARAAIAAILESLRKQGLATD